MSLSKKTCLIFLISVEKPGTGDDTRTWQPPEVNGLSCYFVAVNRNKKSIALDLKKGSSIITKLVRKCDVLVENYVPGTLEKYGLGYEDLRKVNPGLIYCSITGYGASGPYKARGGYDVIAASIGGLLHTTGPMDGEPCKVGVAMTDLATGLYAHGAIMAALFQRYSVKFKSQPTIMQRKIFWLNCLTLKLNLGRLTADKRLTATFYQLKCHAW